MNVQTRHGWFFLLFWVLSFELQAQVTLDLQISKKDKKKVRSLLPPKRYKDTTLLFSSLEKFGNDLKTEGYWDARLAKISHNNNDFRYQVQLGIPTFCNQLRPNDEATEALAILGYQRRLIHLYKKPFSYTSYQKMTEAVLQYCENNGYPFASVQMSNMAFEDHHFNADFLLLKGVACGFDSLDVIGDIKLNKKFLQKYLGIKRGDLYKQYKVDQIEDKLKRFPFLKIEQQPKVSFEVPKAIVKTSVRHQKVDQIDGLLAIVPDPLDEDKIQLTGEVLIDLHNLFNRAIALKLTYQKLRATSEKINLEYDHPAALGASLDLGMKFDLLREDTSFVNVGRQLSLSYHLTFNKRIKVFVQKETSQLGYSPSDTITTLPNISEKKYIGYGMGYRWHLLDDFFAPRQGWFFEVNAMIGNKEIIKNATLETSIYNGIPPKDTQIKVFTRVEHYWHWHKRHVFYTGLHGGLLSSRYMFRNDLLRFGGLKSMRGFLENHFFATQYSVFSLESRYLLGEDSYFFAFYDQGFYKYKMLTDKVYNDNPLGIGVGLNFKTKVGSFSFIYALGKDQNQSIDVNRSIIHFGFVSRF